MAGIKTFRSGRYRPRCLPGDVSLAQLKRDLERGVAHFFGRRPKMHQPGVTAAAFNCRNYPTA